MSSNRLELRPWQVDELRPYLDGPRPGYPSANLLRRGLLERVRPGIYQVTSLGRAALELVDGPGRDPEYVIEILVAASAPNRAAAERIGADVRDAALRTNVRIRDGRIDNVIVADVRSEEDERDED